MLVILILPSTNKTEEGPVGNPVGAIIASVYWPLVVALYLFISFVLGIGGLVG